MDLDIGLRQFEKGIPDRTTILVAGSAGSGKTAFACHVAKAAAKAGLKVAYIDAGHSLLRRVVSYFVADLIRSGGDVRYVSVPDKVPYDTVFLDQMVTEALSWAQLLIFDDVPTAYLAAVDSAVAGSWKDRVKRICARVDDEKMPPVSVAVTYRTARGTEPDEHGSQGTTLVDGRVLPVLVATAAHTMTVETYRVQPAETDQACVTVEI